MAQHNLLIFEFMTLFKKAAEGLCDTNNDYWRKALRIFQSVALIFYRFYQSLFAVRYLQTSSWVTGVQKHQFYVEALKIRFYKVFQSFFIILNSYFHPESTRTFWCIKNKLRLIHFEIFFAKFYSPKIVSTFFMWKRENSRMIIATKHFLRKL